MRVELLLPALTEAKSPFFRPIKYSLFPPLGLATLAAYLSTRTTTCAIQDEHVQELDLDGEPDLVGIEVYVTSARRAYALADDYRARGVRVVLGGLHVTVAAGGGAAPRRRDRHSARPRRRGRGSSPTRAPAARCSASTAPGRGRSPACRAMRRDLIRRELYLVPNSIVVSRGCPHSCDVLLQGRLLRGRPVVLRPAGGRGPRRDRAPARPAPLLPRRPPVRPRAPSPSALFDGMRGMGRLWQAAGTVRRGASSRPPREGRRVRPAEPLRRVRDARRGQPAGARQAPEPRPRLRRRDPPAPRPRGDGERAASSSASTRTTRRSSTARSSGRSSRASRRRRSTCSRRTRARLSTARMEAAGRILHRDWDLYDTRHAVFQPARMTPAQLEDGYRRAYRDFYRWGSILRGAAAKPDWAGRARHAAYAIGWKKCEPAWDALIRARRVGRGLPLLERVLAGAPKARPSGRSPGAAGQAGTTRAVLSAPRGSSACYSGRGAVRAFVVLHVPAEEPRWFEHGRRLSSPSSPATSRRDAVRATAVAAGEPTRVGPLPRFRVGHRRPALQAAGRRGRRRSRLRVRDTARGIHRQEARFQDAPDLCFARLQRELEIDAALVPGPPLVLTSADFADYRDRQAKGSGERKRRRPPADPGTAPAL